MNERYQQYKKIFDVLAVFVLWAILYSLCPSFDKSVNASHTAEGITTLVLAICLVIWLMPVFVAALNAFSMFFTSPIFIRRWRKFQSLKRGCYSFIIVISLFILSFFAEFLNNGNAIFVKYKGDITTHYYGEQAGVAEENKKSSKFYTIGYGDEANGNKAKALLDPTKENIDRVNGIKQALGGDPAAYGYDYCNQTFFSAIGDNDLASIFDKIVEDASESTQHDLNPEDIYHERIDLPDININKKFTLTITKGSGDSTTTVYSVTTESAEQFNFELGREDVNYLKQDANTGGYYIDLLQVQPDSHVKVTYISVN